MTELHNPLFEDEKEFLERQKLEYERALMGDVQEIKEKTLQVSKYAVIGAGVLGGIWLISKAFSGSKSDKKETRKLKAADKKKAQQLKAGTRRPLASTTVDTAVADDLGFGGRRLRPSMPAGQHDSVEVDPFQPATDYNAMGQQNSLVPQRQQPRAKKAQTGQAEHQSDASSIIASTFHAFMQSDTGKMLVAQATAVAIAFVAKKAGDYLPILKNADLAHSDEPRREPETRDIEFTLHHDDADAPSQPA